MLRKSDLALQISTETKGSPILVVVQGLDWSCIQCFASTGEASSAEDSHWLTAQAGYKPVIELCGGTEIGGAFLSGSMLQPQAPATFSTPTLGIYPPQREKQLFMVCTRDCFTGHVWVQKDQSCNAFPGWAVRLCMHGDLQCRFWLLINRLMSQIRWSERHKYPLCDGSWQT